MIKKIKKALIEISIKMCKLYKTSDLELKIFNNSLRIINKIKKVKLIIFEIYRKLILNNNYFKKINYLN